MLISSKKLKLEANEIKVWFASQHHFSDSMLLQRFRSWLSPLELQTLSRFRYPKDQHTYLLAHALLRATLARYSGVEPSALTFHTNLYNKPFISLPLTASDLHFNLSHTDGMVTLGLTRIGTVGIDVEPCVRNNTQLDIAEDVLSPEEYRDLYRISEHERYARFMRYWTLKEAFVKATGLGITSGLKNFMFDLDFDPHPKIRFLTDSDFNACQWQFWQRKVGTDHFIAVACERPNQGEVKINFDEALWLSEM